MHEIKPPPVDEMLNLFIQRFLYKEKKCNTKGLLNNRRLQHWFLMFNITMPCTSFRYNVMSNISYARNKSVWKKRRKLTLPSKKCIRQWFSSRLRVKSLPCMLDVELWCVRTGRCNNPWHPPKVGKPQQLFSRTNPSMPFGIWCIQCGPTNVCRKPECL